MELTLSLVADYASIDRATGKLNVLGVFDRILAHSFPARHERLAVVIKLRPDLLEEPDGHSFSLRLLNADEQGIILFRVDGPFQAPRIEGGLRPDVSLVLELNNLVFPQAGEYRFEVWADDESKGAIPLDVVDAPQPE